MTAMASVLVLIGSFFTFCAFAAGPGGDGYDHGNGGDMCEYRFAVIRDDLKIWLEKGGAKNLRLPSEISYDRYVQTMFDKIQTAKVSCLDEQVFVGVAEKTCKNFVAFDGSLQIKCNRDLFLATAASDQYVLVHHEYAGLAGFEVNDKETSRYQISDQIAGYLENTMTKKLVVKPSLSERDPFNPSICQGPAMSVKEAAKRIAQGVLLEDSTSIAPFTLFMRERRCENLKGCSDWYTIKNQMPHENIFRTETVMHVPDSGLLSLQISSAGLVQTTLLSTQRGLHGQGVHLDCDDTLTGGVQCQLSALPSLKGIGTAVGVVTSQCAYISYRHRLPVNVFPGPGKVLDFRVGPISGGTWVEREAAFISRY